MGTLLCRYDRNGYGEIHPLAHGHQFYISNSFSEDLYLQHTGRTELRMGRIMPAYLLAISSAAYHDGTLRQLTAWWYQGHGHLSTIPQSKRVWTTQAQWGYDGVILV